MRESKYGAESAFLIFCISTLHPYIFLLRDAHCVLLHAEAVWCLSIQIGLSDDVAPYIRLWIQTCLRILSLIGCTYHGMRILEP